jgi:acyl transferase domain-containing protein
LNQTQFTQPALFVVNALTFLNRLLETGELPHFVAGHSLGEATRGCVDLARTLRNLEASGPYLYVDLGPSGSLATAVKYTLNPESKSEFLSVITPFGQESRHLDQVVARQKT